MFCCCLWEGGGCFVNCFCCCFVCMFCCCCWGLVCCCWVCVFFVCFWFVCLCVCLFVCCFVVVVVLFLFLFVCLFVVVVVVFWGGIFMDKAHAKVSYIHLFLQQSDIKYMCTWFILFLRNNLSYIHLLLATQGVLHQHFVRFCHHQMCDVCSASEHRI